MAATKLSHNDYTVAWICALPLEMTAAKVMLKETHESLPQPPTDPNSYTLGSMSGHNVVIACLPSGIYGTTSATAVVTKMHSTFPSLKFALMVGTGGGVPSTSTDVRLGDVVVSTPSNTSGGVIQYDYGKTLPDGRLQRTGSLNKPPQVLLNAVSQMRSDHMIKETDIEETISNTLNMYKQLRKEFSRPDRDSLFDADYVHPSNNPDCSVCDQSRVVKRALRTSHRPQIHYGLIASGNQVMKDAKTRDSIAEASNILCFEMEAAGLMDQLPGCLVIRGICDYCDSHKNKEWQGYAALAAAAYSQRLLTVVPHQKNDSPRYDGSAQLNERLKARQMDILKKLNVSQYRDQKDRNPDRIPGTCEWFVNHKIFQDWQASRTSRMLWVSANPGCGKSVLAKYLADSILTKGVSRTVGYFFFKDDFEEQKSITNALCCILHQLFSQNPDLLTETLIEQFEMNERITNSFSELWNILISSAKEKHAGEIVCLLDALDECEQHGWSQFTEALHRLYTDETRHNLNLKFLITSRPYGRIRRGFQPLDIPGQPIIHLSGESDVEMEKISQEIVVFIEARVKEVKARLRLTEDEHNLLLQKLTRVPNRTYLWVYLTLNLIENKDEIDKRGIVEVTSNLPQSVDEAYEQILSRSTDSQKAKKLLHIVVGAARPLNLQEMNLALALREGHRSYADLALGPEDRFRETMQGLCGLFVTIVDSKIYLLHQTAREFLVQGALETIPGVVERRFKWRRSLRLQESHSMLATICIQHLLFTEFEKAQILTGGVRRLTDNYVFLDYTARYWTAHFLESDLQTDAMLQPLLMICDASTARCQVWFQIYWSSMNTDFPTGFTALMVASYFGLTPVVKHLIKMDGADPDAKDDVHGRSALSWAAGNGHSGVVKILTKRSLKRLLRKRAHVDSGDKHNRTPLSWAILNGHVEAVSLLLRAGAAVDSTDDIGGTPLYYAICSEPTGIIKLLMKHKIQIQSKDDMQKELLLSAAKKGHEPVVKLLLERDADVESKASKYSRTLLSLAAENGHKAVVKLLLEKDADVECKDSQYGRTPLSWAAENGHEVVVGLLLEKEADVECKDSQYGRTPLSWAAENGHEAVVKLLLEKDADVECKDSQYGRTPLSWAAENGHEVVVGLLLEKAGLESKIQHIPKFRDIVGVIVLLHTPLSVDALARFLDISPHHIIDQLLSLNFLRTIFDMPTDPGDLVHFLHLYFRYFLLNTETALRVEKREIHQKILVQCLRIMGNFLKQNICGLPSYAAGRKDINDQIIDRCLPEHLQYSCCHWVYHLKQSDEPINDEVCGFLQKHFLHWLETMSIMGMIFETVGILSTLMTAFIEYDSNLSEFFRDAQRFILRNMQIAGSAPLQLYYSGIAFAPDGSVIRKIFEEKPLRSMAALQTTKQSWSALLQTLEGHSDRVTAVVFSPDGEIVASSSRDRTARFWDIKTGKELQTLRAYSYWSNPTWAFSPDGQIVASSSGDQNIQLWEAKTGRGLQMLKGHHEVTAVVFSPDGQIVVSSSRDRRDLPHLVNRAAFSEPNGILSPISSDRTVRFWDVKTGKKLQTRWAYSYGSNPTWAFSPDGQIVASGSGDQIIQLWEAKTGRGLQILEGHLNKVTAVVFSSDSQIVASGSMDRTVRLWDAKTGKELQVLQGHSNFATEKDYLYVSERVSTVAFSPDSQIVAAGSHDGTVQLWQAKTGRRYQIRQGHSGIVTTMVFCPDGQILASGSCDKTIRLWDAKTGALRDVLHAKTAISSINFSTQGPYLETNNGSFRIQPFNSEHHPVSDEHNPQVSLEEDWVVLGGVRVLWLPLEYRQPSCSAIKEGALVLGYPDGRVCIMQFQRVHPSLH